jgi:hypothetical protein
MPITLDGTAGITNDATDLNYTGTLTGGTGVINIGSGQLVKDASGNVGIGTSSPSTKLTVSGGVAIQGTSASFPSSGQGWELSPESATACVMQAYNRTGNAWLDGKYYAANLIFLTNGSNERMRIDSSGNVAITQSPGRYTIDTSGGATSIANNGTVDFPNASGMLLVNSYATGVVSMYLCGAGQVVLVSNIGAQLGTFVFNIGINGYTWTNNTGSAATFGFFFVRTRPGA